MYESFINFDDLFCNATVYFWTDSMAALRWIQGVKQWPPFVENRVTIIRKLGLVSSFRFINTDANPADLLTRSLTFEQLKDKKLW